MQKKNTSTITSVWRAHRIWRRKHYNSRRLEQLKVSFPANKQYYEGFRNSNPRNLRHISLRRPNNKRRRYKIEKEMDPFREEALHEAILHTAASLMQTEAYRKVLSRYSNTNSVSSLQPASSTNLAPTAQTVQTTLYGSSSSSHAPSASSSRKLASNIPSKSSGVKFEPAITRIVNEHFHEPSNYDDANEEENYLYKSEIYLEEDDASSYVVNNSVGRALKTAIVQ